MFAVWRVTTVGVPLKPIRYLFLVLSIAVFASCGSDGASSGSESFQKITPSEQQFTIDDFKAVRFKVSTQYDVEGLTAATEAWFGFWTPAGLVTREFEIRFYPSHSEAVEFGTLFAIEGSGDTALLEPEDATWDEGLKDRRAFFAGIVGSHGSGSVQPLYGGYVIYGNMVMLCEGANEDQALEFCAALIDTVLTPVAQ